MIGRIFPSLDEPVYVAFLKLRAAEVEVNQVFALVNTVEIDWFVFDSPCGAIDCVDEIVVSINAPTFFCFELRTFVRAVGAFFVVAVANFSIEHHFEACVADVVVFIVRTARVSVITALAQLSIALSTEPHSFTHQNLLAIDAGKLFEVRVTVREDADAIV